MSHDHRGKESAPVERRGDVVVKRRPGRPDRLRAEAAHLAAAGGPGLVPLRRLVDDHDDVELHLEAAAGSVADVVTERGLLSEAETRAVGVAAAAALARLHEVGIVHADLKPANLLLSADGQLWVADLDAACLADGRPLERGSPGRSRPGATARPDTDVVALAVTLVELAGGVVPDPSLRWDRAGLVEIGCPPALATDLALVLARESVPSARDLAEVLGTDPILVMPEPPTSSHGVDPTPTIDFEPALTAPVPRTGPTPPHDPVPAALVLLALIAVVVLAATLAL